MPLSLSCDCCGRGFEDTPKDNAWHGIIPYPGDMPNTGMCRACGGDPAARDIRKKLGWAMTTFVDARIPIIRDALSAKNRVAFEAMSYEAKVHVVTRMVEKGYII